MMVEKTLKALAPMLTEAKLARITSVVSSRTHSLAVLLENVTNLGNENAVIRTMDALGVQNMHSLTWGKVLEKAQSQEPKSTDRSDSGSRKWVTIHNWCDLPSCIKHLKAEGYRIAVAAPNTEMSISDLDCTQRLVLAFGNEMDGASDQMMEVADTAFSLPMCGFVQSYNISVAAAISLYHAYTQRLRNLGCSSDLSERERLELTLHLVMKSLDIDDQKPHSVLNDSTT